MVNGMFIMTRGHYKALGANGAMFVCMYVCVFMYVCMYVCMYVYM